MKQIDFRSVSRLLSNPQAFTASVLDKRPYKFKEFRDAIRSSKAAKIDCQSNYLKAVHQCFDYSKADVSASGPDQFEIHSLTFLQQEFHEELRQSVLSPFTIPNSIWTAVVEEKALASKHWRWGRETSIRVQTTDAKGASQLSKGDLVHVRLQSPYWRAPQGLRELIKPTTTDVSCHGGSLSKTKISLLCGSCDLIRCEPADAMRDLLRSQSGTCPNCGISGVFTPQEKSADLIQPWCMSDNWPRLAFRAFESDWWWLGEIVSCTVGIHIADLHLDLYPAQREKENMGTVEDKHSPPLEGRGLFLCPLRDNGIPHRRLENGVHDFATKRGYDQRSPDSNFIHPLIYSAFMCFGNYSTSAFRPTTGTRKVLELKTLNTPTQNGSQEMQTNARFELFNKQLDANQAKAVELSIQQHLESNRRKRKDGQYGPPPVTVIEGFPGSGKTETAIEIIRQMKRIAEATLFPTIIQAYCPTHVGAKKLRERLALYGVQSYGADRLAASIFSDERRADGKSVCVKKRSNVNLETESSHLFNTSCLSSVSFPWIVVDTPHQASYLVKMCRSLRSPHSDSIRLVSLFDEAAYQSILPTTIPLSLGCDQLILIGDSKQLLPVQRFTPNDTPTAIPKSIFSTLYPLSQRCTLHTSRRLPPLLAQATSNAFYGGRLVPSSSAVNDDALSSGASSLPLLGTTLTYIDTGARGTARLTKSDAYLDVMENVHYPSFWRSQSYNRSHFNRGECILTMGIVEALLHARVSYNQIAIITPYRAQRDLLNYTYGIPIRRSHRAPKEDTEQHLEVPTICTIDSTQGLEFNTVILSVTKTSDTSTDDEWIQNSFLESDNRWNVATTRATRRLILLGDHDVLSQSRPFMKWQKSLNLLGRQQGSSDDDEKIRVLRCEEIIPMLKYGMKRAGAKASSLHVELDESKINEHDAENVHDDALRLGTQGRIS